MFGCGALMFDCGTFQVAHNLLGSWNTWLDCLLGIIHFQYGTPTHIPVCSVDSQIVELLCINSRNVSIVLGAADDTEASCWHFTHNLFQPSLII